MAKDPKRRLPDSASTTLYVLRRLAKKKRIHPSSMAAPILRLCIERGLVELNAYGRPRLTESGEARLKEAKPREGNPYLQEAWRLMAQQKAAQ